MIDLQEKTVQLNKLNVHYWETNRQQGHVVLLLHGAMADAYAHWSGIMPLLADTYRVIAPDLPGFGESDSLPKASLPLYVEWLRAFLDALEIEDAVIIGSSFSGVLARAFSSAYPHYVPALVLVNGGILPLVPNWLRIVVKIPIVSTIVLRVVTRSMTSPEKLRETVKNDAVITDEFVRCAKGNARGLVSTSRVAMTAADLDSGQLVMPVMILWGIEDTLAPEVEARRLRRAIPGAQYAPIADCGHYPHLETPEIFAFQVKKFLESSTHGPPSSLPGAGLLKSQ